MADEAGIDKSFKLKRKGRKKKLFEYERRDEAPQLSPEENFKINYFLVIVDAVRMSCQPRFEALETYRNKFGFMYNIRCLRGMKDEDLMNNCRLAAFIKQWRQT